MEIGQQFDVDVLVSKVSAIKNTIFVKLVNGYGEDGNDSRYEVCDIEDRSAQRALVYLNEDGEESLLILSNDIDATPLIDLV